jgi:hypothetical protein
VGRGDRRRARREGRRQRGIERLHVLVLLGHAQAGTGHAVAHQLEQGRQAAQHIGAFFT